MTKNYEDENEDGVIKLVLPKPHIGQEMIIRSQAKFRVVMSGRQFGKSTVASILTIESLLKGHDVCYITPTFSLGRNFFNNLINIIPQSLMIDQNIASLYIKMVTGGTVMFFSGESSKSIRGRKFNRAIIDEAAFIPTLEEIFQEVLSPAFATTDGDMIFFSTPNGRNYFHSLWSKGRDGAEGYQSFHFSSFDSPYVKKEWLEKIKAEVSEEIFNQEYRAIPLSGNSNPFGLQHIRNNTIDNLSNKETVVYACDVARNIDASVIVGLDEDGCMSYFDVWRGEWSYTEMKILQLPGNILKVIDSTGAGSVLYESLAAQMNNVRGFNFTIKSKPAIMKELINAVQKSRLKFNRYVAQEMESFTYSQTERGHPEYKAQTGYFDDSIMALAMCNHFLNISKSNTSWTLYST